MFVASITQQPVDPDQFATPASFETALARRNTSRSRSTSAFLSRQQRPGGSLRKHHTDLEHPHQRSERNNGPSRPSGSDNGDQGSAPAHQRQPALFACYLEHDTARSASRSRSRDASTQAGTGSLSMLAALLPVTSYAQTVPGTPDAGGCPRRLSRWSGRRCVLNTCHFHGVTSRRPDGAAVLMQSPWSRR
jgi:hypothetical protein